ncbi:unnamed protein product [Ambrosiozyma monospora]|uniref:Unnamed protein product n=1 Tax=Ambrosiozyma monospora TaxID=43982 RepID=A0A9W6YU55_AMBMO|nr:unnamed protein product [Ambrosiozyma monospora]
MNSIEKLRNLIPIEKRNKWVVFTICLVSLGLDNLNVSGGITSTISIQEAFNTTSTNSTWVISAYALTLGSFILIFGKLSDILGAHNVFLFGSCIMTLFSLICAVIDNSIIALIVFRALQGIGGSALVPSSVGLTAAYFGHDLKLMRLANKCFLFALTGSFGAGMLIGGGFALTDLGYKSFFYFSFGLSSVCSIVLFFTIIPVPTHDQTSLKDLNYAGVLVLVGGLLLMILGLTEGGHKWRQPVAYVTLPIGFLMVLSVFLFETVYIRRYRIKHANKSPIDDQNDSKSIAVSPLKKIESQVKEVARDNSTSSDSKENETPVDTPAKPESNSDWRLTMNYLFPPECGKIPNFFVFLFLIIPFYIILTVNLTGLFQYHQFVEHNSSIISALKIFCMPVGIVIGIFSFRESFVVKFGTKWYMIFCGSLALGSSIWFSRVDFRKEHSFYKYEMVSLAISGFSVNYYFNVFLNSVMANTPMHLQGSIAGIYFTAGQVGVSIGDAIFTSVVGELSVAVTLEEKEALHKRIINGLYVSVAACAIIFLVSLFTTDTDSIKAKEKFKEKANEIAEKSDSDGSNFEDVEKQI